MFNIAYMLANVNQVGSPWAIFEKFGVSWPLLIAQIINFCIVSGLLYKFAFKPILKTITQRQEQIAEGLQYAQESKNKLIQAEREVQLMLQQATQDAQAIMQEAKISAKAYLDEEAQTTALHIEAMLKKSQEATRIEYNNMLLALRQELTHTVVNLTSKLLKKELSPEDKRSYFDQITQELNNQ